MNIPRIDLVTWFNRMSAFPMGTLALDRVMWRVVPFNQALRPHVTRVTRDVVVVEQRLRRLLTNHLGCMHAAALVSVGEYAQGLVILANAGAIGAELILANLVIDYAAKARGDVHAEARMDDATRTHVKDGLARGDNLEVVLHSVIRDAASGEELARLRGTWKARPPPR